MRTRVVRTALVASVLAVLATFALSGPAQAGQGDDVQAGCSGSGCTVSVSYSGTAVNHTPGGGAVSSVPPDCWFEKWTDPKTAYAVRILIEAFNALLPGLLELPMQSVEEFKTAATDPKYKDYSWYLLKCRDGINQLTSQAAMDTAGTTSWFGKQVALMTLLLGPGEAPEPGGVSVKTLLDAAQKSMRIPDPVVERNPKMQGSGATIVNLNTLFWSDTAQQDQSITATAGPVSVTITAKPKGYVLSSPAGSVSCTAEQFATPWTNGMDESQGCGITFAKASAAAGWPVTVSSTWEASFTATGMPQPQPLDPVTASTTVDVPVSEVQSVVTSTN